MRNKSQKLVVMGFSLLTTAACAIGVGVAAKNTAPTAHTAADELSWVESGFGPQVSPVSGDFSSEGHVTYVKFPAGMTTPLHTHTHDYVGIVVTGVSMHWEPGKPETKKKLSAGAHWFVPANTPHVSECLPGVECIMAIYQQAAMDFLPHK